MRASKERPSYASLLALIGALGNANSLSAMDGVLDEFARHKYDVGIDAITKLIYHHGCLHDIDGKIPLLADLMCFM
jgi:hypothetical protein